MSIWGWGWATAESQAPGSEGAPVAEVNLLDSLLRGALATQVSLTPEAHPKPQHSCEQAGRESDTWEDAAWEETLLSGKLVRHGEDRGRAMLLRTVHTRQAPGSEGAPVAEVELLDSLLPQFSNHVSLTAEAHPKPQHSCEQAGRESDTWEETAWMETLLSGQLLRHGEDGGGAMLLRNVHTQKPCPSSSHATAVVHSDADDGAGPSDADDHASVVRPSRPAEESAFKVLPGEVVQAAPTSAVPPKAHHALSLGRAGPIVAQIGQRVVLTGDYWEPRCSSSGGDRSCCVAYAHSVVMSFGKHLGKSFRWVRAYTHTHTHTHTPRQVLEMGAQC